MKKTMYLVIITMITFQLQAQDEIVNGKLTVTERIFWGSTGAVLNTDQGASVELRGTGVPYFDFSNDATTDYDMRLILTGNDQLAIRGGNVSMSNKLSWGSAGAVLNTDQGASIELRGTGVPYFDFSNDATTDYDMRLILTGNDQLAITGGNVSMSNKLSWGSAGAVLNTDQGASIELRGTGVPYFDFSNDATTDYDMRLILTGNDQLAITGGNVSMSNKLSTGQSISWGSAGALLNTDQGASIELRGTGVPYLDFSNDATTDYDMRLILTNDNTLGVSGGNMAVDGTVNAREIHVKNNVWSDFVFHEAYDLPTLQEVEDYIQQKGHLPNIPSEKEVLQNGIDLGEMDAKLLQKIEELTLYTIEQQKEIERLKIIEKRLAEIEKLVKTQH